MRASLRLNNDLTIPEYVALAQAAERAGFDQFWISNDLFLRSGPVLLAAVAQATTRIEIGSCVLNPHTIHPAELAMFAATMDELTGGRFNLGLAAGAADFLRWVGIEDPHPVRTMRETIAAVRALLRGDALPDLHDGAGRTPAARGAAYLRFKAPRVTPIYLGAMGPNMLRLAGEIADGALPLLFPPEHWATVAPLIAGGAARRTAGGGRAAEDLHAGEQAAECVSAGASAARAGDDGGRLATVPDIAACVWVSLSDDMNAARRALAEKVAYYGHALGPLIYERLGLARDDFSAIEHALTVERDVDRAVSLVTDAMLKVGVCGTPAQLVERLRPLVAAGVRHVSFGPPLGPDPLRAVELLGRDVVPALREGP